MIGMKPHHRTALLALLERTKQECGMDLPLAALYAELKKPAPSSNKVKCFACGKCALAYGSVARVICERCVK